MTARRVYLPADTETLASWWRAGALPAEPVLAFAVTAAVRAAFPEEDEEDLEYAAMWAAAAACRRGVVVAAADLDAGRVTDAGSAAPDAPALTEDNAAYAVVVAGPSPLSAIVSVHVAQDGDGADDELTWYDASEVPALLEAPAGP